MSCLLSIVVPVYNEEQTLPKFLAAIRPALSEVTEDYEIIFAADPCTDRTIEILREENERDPRVKLLLFSRRIYDETKRRPKFIVDDAQGFERPPLVSVRDGARSAAEDS